MECIKVGSFIVWKKEQYYFENGIFNEMET